jgi:hypothetical protein
VGISSNDETGYKKRIMKEMGYIPSFMRFGDVS